jgi:hypothetical protein
MKKLVLLLIAVLPISGVARAISLNIEIGDQPYYVHGAGYWAGGVYYVWVPGHWGPHHHWIHGHYRVR